MAEYVQFAVNHWELTLALVVTLLMLGWNLFGTKIRGINEISPEQAIRIINDDDPLIIDVREEKEVALTGIIPNSTHIALGNLSKDKLAELGKKNPTAVIATCKNGARSIFACSRLKKSGFENVHNLKGGVTAWQQAGLPLKTKK